CALGSVKSMIGHTKAAAGAAGLIKAALSLYNKTLPPTLKADIHDPELSIDKSHFYLNIGTRPWFSKKGHPRRAGVSAFGFGGSNFHILVEEYKSKKRNISWDGSIEIVALSASSKNRLVKLVSSLKNSLDKGISNKEFSKTAADTRTNFSFNDRHRLLFVIKQPLNSSRHTSLPFDEALDALSANKQKGVWNLQNIYYGGPDYINPENRGKIAFMFPGQGSQYTQMGCDLVCCFPEALEVMEIANSKYKNNMCLTDYIYPLPIQSDKEKKCQEDALKSTDIAQPAIGTISLAMINVLQEFGIKPDATCGHSYGELSALYAAGWMDINTLFDLSIARGNLMASAGRNNNDSGTMLAVKAPINELEELINSSDTGAILANKNSPKQGVLSGSVEAIAMADKICRQKGFKTIKLSVAAAFHSALIKDAQKPFAQLVQDATIVPSEVPVFSNTTGMPYPADSDRAKALLGRQILSPVDFVSEIENLFKAGAHTFVEIGPRTVLTGLAESILKGQKFHAVSMDSSCGKGSGIMDLAKTLSLLASLGHNVNLNKWEAPVRKTRKQLMNIPVTGANYRPEPKQRKKIANPPHPETQTRQITASTQNQNKMDKAMGTNNMIKDKAQQPDLITD
ncbi:MAG: acyltransferase domain-containing protein, partial [Thermodesulfobacteriota bacterium]|nr:acyltransferase domain-containing protein [Thermodesulfobacteriota bacterium]